MRLDKVRPFLGLSSHCQLTRVRLRQVYQSNYNLSVPHFRFSPVCCDPLDWELQPRPEVAVAFQADHKATKTGQVQELLRLSLPSTAYSWEKRLAVIAELGRLIRNGGPDWIVASYPICRVNHPVNLEHIPVAILGEHGNLLWVNPAAKAHGLLNIDFPDTQRHRVLGDEIDWDHWQDAHEISSEDEATGLPVWFLRTKNELASFGLPCKDLTRTVIHFHATKCAWDQKALDLEPFVETAVAEYLSTFKRYFTFVPEGLAQAIAS